MLSVLLGIVLLASVLELIMIARAKSLSGLANDLQTILIVFLFIVFIYVVVAFNLVPARLRKSLGQVNNLVTEISQGNYQIEIDPANFDSDKELQALVKSLGKMLNVLNRFDQSKAEKIYEHHLRLQLLMNLLPQISLIALTGGEIKYCNDALRRRYQMISEEQNINEALFKDLFDQNIFGRIYEALRYGDNLYDVKIPSPDNKQLATLNGAIVRNRKGVATGGVFIIDIKENAK